MISKNIFYKINNRNTVVLVDVNDQELGTADKITAHEQGLLHRAFSVMLYRYHHNQLEFLLQKRALDKYHCAGLWTNTCCSHPSIGEDIKISALKRLQEELLDIDLDKINLKNIGSFIYRAEFSNGLTEHEYDHVFIAEYNNTPNWFNKNEIAELAWFSVDYIKNNYNLNKDSYTPWFGQVIDLISI